MNKKEPEYIYEDFGTYDAVAFSLNKFPDAYNVQLDYVKFDEDTNEVTKVKSVATGMVGETLDDVTNLIDHLIKSGVLNDYYLDLDSSYIYDVELDKEEQTTFFKEKFSHYLEQ